MSVLHAAWSYIFFMGLEHNKRHCIDDRPALYQVDFKDPVKALLWNNIAVEGHKPFYCISIKMQAFIFDIFE